MGFVRFPSNLQNISVVSCSVRNWVKERSSLVGITAAALHKALYISAWNGQLGEDQKAQLPCNMRKP